MSTNPNPQPTFIAVGPEKTGTSWLHRVLNEHEDIWLPPPKEIRYFYEKFYLPGYSTYERLTSSHWHFQKWKKYIRDRKGFYFSSNLIRPAKLTRQFLWDCKYLFAKRDDEWYKSLFPINAISGDISPVYAEFTLEEVRRVHELCSHSKIIISLRDPVERLWSLAKMVLLKYRGRDFASVTEQEFYDFFAERLTNRPGYSQIITNWRSIFGNANVYISFYEDLEQQPYNYVKDILDFLGLDEKKLHQNHPFLNKQVNKGIALDIPDTFKSYLWNMVEEDTIELQKMLQYPQIDQWIDKYNCIKTK